MHGKYDLNPEEERAPRVEFVEDDEVDEVKSVKSIQFIDNGNIVKFNDINGEITDQNQISDQEGYENNKVENDHDHDNVNKVKKGVLKNKLVNNYKLNKDSVINDKK